MRYMLDTNICVYLIRQRPADLFHRLSQYSLTDVCISAITAGELQFGAYKSSQPLQNQHALEQFLAPLTIADFDYEAATAYGRIRAHLEAQGMGIGSLDTLIAGHALSRQLVLVTMNTKEFSRVPGLSLDDWSRPQPAS